MNEGRTKQRGASTTRDTGFIVCPFFRSHNGFEINCEGYTDEMVCAFKYRAHRDKAQQQRIYCEDNYKYCEHYNALMLLKYSEVNE
jgi:hypothetical protein